MLNIRGLHKTFKPQRKSEAGVIAVEDVSIEVGRGELFTLLGPSGCGKTTTLRCIAGLEYPDAGEIRVGDRTLFSSENSIRLRANERGLGMVFQSYAIWPHMDVFKNVAFPLQVLPKATRPSRKVISARVERALNVVRLGELAGRRATALSGGQQQRLALARALVMEPPLLLLDEPLSNLDAKLREEMRFELKRLQRELDVTAIYVTHDQVEALAMSTTIAVMNKGRIEQRGRPRDVYEKPQSRFVADFIGSSNFLPGTVIERTTPERVLVDTEVGPAEANCLLDYKPGAKVVLSVRPEHVALAEGHPTSDAVGQWAGVVRARAFLGESVDHVVQVGSMEIQARCNPTISIPADAEVTVSISPETCSLIDAG
jgi:iron(III) transport system ATP-binding protein